MGDAARQRIRGVCDDQTVVARRIDHARSLRPNIPSANPDRQVAVLTFAGIEGDVRDALTAAMRANEAIDAVVPWLARSGPDGHEIVPFSTPDKLCPELLIEHPGPVAIDASWWEKLEQAGVHGNAASILRGLINLGARVAVLPEVIAGGTTEDFERPGTPMPQRLSDAERAVNAAHRARQAAEQAADFAQRDRDDARDELAAIRGSRAYTLAERLSRLRRRLLG